MKNFLDSNLEIRKKRNYKNITEEKISITNKDYLFDNIRPKL